MSHAGDVYSSGILPASAGDVRERPLLGVYRKADLMQALRDADWFSGPCGRSPFRW